MWIVRQSPFLVLCGLLMLCLLFLCMFRPAKLWLCQILLLTMCYAYWCYFFPGYRCFRISLVCFIRNEKTGIAKKWRIFQNIFHQQPWLHMKISIPTKHQRIKQGSRFELAAHIWQLLGTHFCGWLCQLSGMLIFGCGHAGHSNTIELLVTSSYLLNVFSCITLNSRQRRSTWWKLARMLPGAWSHGYQQ